MIHEGLSWMAWTSPNYPNFILVITLLVEWLYSYISGMEKVRHISHRMFFSLQWSGIALSVLSGTFRSIVNRVMAASSLLLCTPGLCIAFASLETALVLIASMCSTQKIAMRSINSPQQKYQDGEGTYFQSWLVVASWSLWASMRPPVCRPSVKQSWSTKANRPKNPVTATESELPKPIVSLLQIAWSVCLPRTSWIRRSVALTLICTPSQSWTNIAQRCIKNTKQIFVKVRSNVSMRWQLWLVHRNSDLPKFAGRLQGQEAHAELSHWMSLLLQAASVQVRIQVHITNWRM